jgi:hypothetical protein
MPKNSSAQGEHGGAEDKPMDDEGKLKQQLSLQMPSTVEREREVGS